MMAMEIVPTTYAIKMRPVFMFCLVTLVALVIGKFVISDFWGGISLGFVVLMGAFVLSGEYGLDVVNCLFFAVMAVISGIFDIVSCVMYMQHSKYSLFDMKAPTMVLVAQGVFVLSPLMLFVSAGVAYSIYADCRDRGQEAAPFGSGLGSEYGYGGSPSAGAAPQAPRSQPQAPPQQPTHFQGQGRRLGA